MTKFKVKSGKEILDTFYFFSFNLIQIKKNSKYNL